MYGMAPDQLDRYREVVAGAEPRASWRRSSRPREARYRRRGRDVLETGPRGCPAENPRIGLLRYKGSSPGGVAVEGWPENAAARDRVAAFLRTTRPLSTWLAENVGPPATEGTAR